MIGGRVRRVSNLDLRILYSFLFTMILIEYMGTFFVAPDGEYLWVL